MSVRTAGVDSMAPDEPTPVFPPPGTQPIISPDGRWLWTGTAWVRRTPPNAPPVVAALLRVDGVGARVVVVGLVWLVLLAAAAFYVLASAGNLTGKASTVELMLGSVATIGFGCYMGVRRCGEVLAAAMLGAIALMLIYAAAWLQQPRARST